MEPPKSLKKTNLKIIEDTLAAHRPKLMECFASEVISRGAMKPANDNENWFQVGRRLYGEAFETAFRKQKEHPQSPQQGLL